MAAGLPPDFSQDDFNPYAPPKRHEPLHQPTAVGVVPFDPGLLVKATWALYRERLGACLGICWAAFALLWGSQFVQQRLVAELVPRAGGRFEAFLLQLTLFLVVYVFNAWISIGQSLAMLGVARRQPWAFDQLFRGGRFVLTTLFAGVVFGLLVGAVTLVGLIAIPILAAVVGRGGAGMILVFGGAFVFALVAAVYVSTRLSQFPYMIIDRNAGVIDSLGFSWEATRGGAGTLIVVYAFLVMICLLGLLACFVGLLFAAPFAYLMLAVTYLSLTGQSIGRKPREIEYWDQDEPELPSYLS
jgi:hypothetical protein